MYIFYKLPSIKLSLPFPIPSVTSSAPFLRLVLAVLALSTNVSLACFALSLISSPAKQIRDFRMSKALYFEKPPRLR
jgi:hypothetical protein